jgi:drug/metabolite transporter (DMT)-like permease
VVFPVGVAAAFCLGLGYVLQQRAAARTTQADLVSWRLLFALMHNRAWWIGIGAMVAGQVLGGLALDLAAVTIVEPLLSASLLFAFAISAFLSSQRLRWHEVLGALLVSAALAVFLAVGNPQAVDHPRTNRAIVVLAVCVVAGVVLVLTLVGKRFGLIGKSILLATGAGILYGLQDASTRAAFNVINRHGLVHLFTRLWVYIVVAAAVVGIMLSQSAFKAARLDYSLPPISAAEPVAGIALGIALLGDTVSVSIPGLAAEAACLAAMIIGVILIGRSRTLAEVCVVTDDVRPDESAEPAAAEARQPRAPNVRRVSSAAADD